MSIKQQIINFMATERVFRSGSVVEQGNILGISKRSTDTYIQELVQEGKILAAHRGLYFISHPAKPVSRSEIAVKLSPHAFVSMDTALLDDRSLISDTFHLVTDKGRIGSFETPLGPIAIHGLPKKLVTYAEKALGMKAMYKALDGNGSVKVASDAVACIHIAYLNNQRKRQITYGDSIPSAIIKNLDLESIQDLSKRLDVSLKSFPELKLTNPATGPDSPQL